MTHTPAPAGSRAVASTIGSDAPGSATARGMVLAIAAAALAVVSVLPPLVMPVLLGLLMVLFAWGWPQLLGVPSPGGSAIVIALVGLGALVGTTVLGSARPIVPAIGIGVLAAFLQQMMRKEGRPRLTDAISGTVSGLVIAASGAGWVVLESLGGGREALLVASAAMSAGALAHFLPAPRPVVLGGIMVTAALVGLGVGSLLSVSLVAAGAVGLALGALIASCYVVFEGPTERHVSAMPSAALAPLLAIGLPVMQAIHLLN